MPTSRSYPTGVVQNFNWRVISVQFLLAGAFFFFLPRFADATGDAARLRDRISQKIEQIAVSVAANPKRALPKTRRERTKHGMFNAILSFPDKIDERIAAGLAWGAGIEAAFIEVALIQPNAVPARSKISRQISEAVDRTIGHSLIEGSARLGEQLYQISAFPDEIVRPLEIQLRKLDAAEEALIERMLIQPRFSLASLPAKNPDGIRSLPEQYVALGALIQVREERLAFALRDRWIELKSRSVIQSSAVPMRFSAAGPNVYAASLTLAAEHIKDRALPRMIGARSAP